MTLKNLLIVKLQEQKKLVEIMSHFDNDTGNIDNQATKKFFLCCKNSEDDSDDELIKKLKAIVSGCKHGFNSININYQSNRSDEFCLKFIFKFIKPKTLEFIMDNFMEHNSIPPDWLIIDNDVLKNNVLHYLVCDVNIKEFDKASNMIDQVFNCDKKYQSKLDICHNLLYQYNAYSYTPAQYAQKRKVCKIGYMLESIQFRHMMDLFIVQYKIPQEIALIVMQYGFELFHKKKLYEYYNIDVE